MSEDKTGTVRTTAFSNRIIWIFAVFMFEKLNNCQLTAAYVIPSNPQ